jgi:ribosome-binding protein aMBF1 (putative translation factor)
MLYLADDAELGCFADPHVRDEPVMRMPENFAQTVRKVRLTLDLSQEELAHALGVSFATVNRWENSKTRPSKLAQRQFEQFCTQKKSQGELS